MNPDDTPPSNTPSSNAPPSNAPSHRRPSSLLRTAGTAATVLLTTLAATAVAGIPAGYIWALLAPRDLAQVVSRGAANVLVNPETTAFIAADAWFVLIAAIGGLLTGVAGYLFVVRRRGAPAALGLILGGLAAAALMVWIGDNYGHASFLHQLLTRPNGTYLHASLSLGSKSAIIFWPLAAALAIVIPEAVAYFRAARAPAVRNVDEDAVHGARSVD